MSNDNTEVFTRLFVLWAAICKMIVDGKRNAQDVADILQGIVSEKAEEIKEVAKIILRDIGNVLITFAQKKALTGFTFETRDGLYVEDAVTALLGKSVTAPTQADITLGKHALNVNATDTSITDELKPGYVFKEKENGKELLKWVIASLVLAQWGGTSGILLNNDYANIFYFERADGVRFTVSVFWHSGRREWSVLLWKFDDFEWDAENVVFSRN